MYRNKTIKIKFPKEIGGHPKQELVWQDDHRFIDIMAGRRGGKDWIGTRKAIKNIYGRDFLKIKDQQIKTSIKKNLPRLFYWFVAPTYQLTKVIIKHIFKFLDFDLIQYDGTRSSSPHIWLYPEIKIEFKSGEKPEHLVGEGLNGLYITETARLKSAVWNDNLRPTLSDMNGWGIFCTTPLGLNWYIEEIRKISEGGGKHEDEWIAYYWKTIENTKNESLQAEVRKAKETMPKKYYLRNYEALPEAFHGQVYEEFVQGIHLQEFKIDIKDYKVVVAGVDWGYTHHGGYVVLGITGKNTIDVLIERSLQKIPVVSENPDQKTWVNIAKEDEKKYGIDVFYCGPDEPEHIAAFRESGLVARKANNNVKPGIQMIATFLHINDENKSRFRIHKKNCPRLAKYLPAYRWAEEKDGEHSEMPHKVNDDECDMLRYGAFSAKNWLGYDLEE